jgi:hypothetical protein
VSSGRMVEAVGEVLRKHGEKEEVAVRSRTIPSKGLALGEGLADPC